MTKDRGIRVCWRRYGKGGAYRAEWPGHWAETPQRDVIDLIVAKAAADTGLPVVDETTANPPEKQ